MRGIGTTSQIKTYSILRDLDSNHAHKGVQDSKTVAQDNHHIGVFFRVLVQALDTI